MHSNDLMTKKILILIHSRTGNTLLAAKKVKEGMERNGNISAEIKRVPPFLLLTPSLEEVIELPIATVEELESYDGLIFGSPVYFYGPAAEMLAFLQSGMDLWKKQSLKNKPAGTFLTSNGNGISFAKDTLMATLNALFLDTNILENACNMSSGDINNNLTEYGACLHKTLLGLQPGHGIELPPPPEPVGLYKPYAIAGNLVFINQIALKDGKIEYPGAIGVAITEEEAKISTRDCMLNVLAVLGSAVGGDFSRVKQIVHIAGHFNARDGYVNHSAILNEASKVAVEFLGPSRGISARSAFGASSLPMNSPVELQAIVEIE